MSTSDDNDFLTGPVPEPEAEATPAERAHAKTFADLVDKTLAGRTPPAMSADDRALLEVATVIRAASGNVELPAQTKRSLVEGALKQAVGAASPSTVVPITRARRRWVPWTIAGVSSAVAAAAIALLIVRQPARPVVPAAAAMLPAEIPVDQRSRPTDDLFGPIARDRAGDATTRIDTIFADRLDGYRDRELGRGGKP